MSFDRFDGLAVDDPLSSYTPRLVSGLLRSTAEISLLPDIHPTYTTKYLTLDEFALIPAYQRLRFIILTAPTRMKTRHVAPNGLVSAVDDDLLPSATLSQGRRIRRTANFSWIAIGIQYQSDGFYLYALLHPEKHRGWRPELCKAADPKINRAPRADYGEMLTWRNRRVPDELPVLNPGETLSWPHLLRRTDFAIPGVPSWNTAHTGWVDVDLWHPDEIVVSRAKYCAGEISPPETAPAWTLNKLMRSSRYSQCAPLEKLTTVSPYDQYSNARPKHLIDIVPLSARKHPHELPPVSTARRFRLLAAARTRELRR